MKLSVPRAVRLLPVVGLLALTLFAPSAASAGDPCYHGFDMPAPSTEETTQVKLMPCAFEPTVAVVEPGATVEFVNGPEFVHLITGANQLWGSREVEVKPNTVVSYTFETPGVYPYACALHVGMSGAIVVGQAAAGAGAGPVTAGGENPQPEQVATSAPVIDQAAIDAAEAAAAESINRAAQAQAASAFMPVELAALAAVLIVATLAGLASALLRRRSPAAHPLAGAE